MPKTSVSLESVMCRLESKEITSAAERLPDDASSMIASLKITRTVRNGMRADNEEPPISLRDWGLLIVFAGLSAIACHEEKLAEKEAGNG